MLNVIIYAILLLAAIGAIIGWNGQKKGQKWGQSLTLVCALIAIFLGFFQVYLTSVGGLNSHAASVKRQQAYHRSQGIVLGRYLNAHFSGKTAVIIKDPTRQQESDALIALRKEIYNNIKVTAIITPTATVSKDVGMPDGLVNYEPVERWYTKKVLEQLLEGKHFDILITDLGLPSDLTVVGKEFTIHSLKGKQVAMLSGNIYDYMRAFINRRIAAAVVHNPKAEYDAKPAPKDPQNAFNRRYLLVTPDNYRDMVIQYDVFKR